MEESTTTTTTQLGLPGFRFHPTEQELLEFYLKNVVYTKKVRFDDVIGLLNIYHHEPWDLPGLAKIGEREWYFFVARDRKQGSGGRPNRTTETGFWKATGSDRRIFSLFDQKKVIGLRKTLVFYKGRAPRGSKTDWVMNEYRLPDTTSIPKDVVLCKIYRKATSLKVLEQRAALEEETKAMQSHIVSPSLSDPNSFRDHGRGSMNRLVFKTEEEQQQIDGADENTNHSLVVPSLASGLELPSGHNINNGLVVGPSTASSIKLPSGYDILADLQVPKMSMDWTQDSFWSMLNSPWLQNYSSSCANILNF